jgi:superfamily II DNA or RNA helicase
MGLKDLQLKQWYDSDTDDILNSFYLPALSETICYKRLVGFFSSASFAITAKGVLKLIKNGGKIQLITSPKFQIEDIEAIKSSVKSVEEVSEEKLLEELNNITEEFIMDHVKALSWMLKNNILEIKIAIVYDDEGYPLCEDSISKEGMFHQKVGLLEDVYGNKLSFSGSENESANAWLNNIEEFKVFRNWIESESSYYESDELKFNKFWDEKSKKTKIINLPQAVKMKLFEIAPADIDKINLEKWNKSKNKKLTLRNYQNKAVENWLKNKNGIFEMATGTGKTITALSCVKKIIDLENKLVVIISTPYIHLNEQWLNELNKLEFKYDSIIADSSKSKWKDKLVDNLIDIKNKIIDVLFIFTTHNTFSSSDFITIIKKYKPNELKYFLIVDEVHGIGAPIRRKGLINEYDYRLGLSATPKRWFDYEGTEKIFEYFGNTIFEFSLTDAIKEGYLSPYIYKPYLTHLSSEEMDSYITQTKKISKSYYSTEDKLKKDQIFSLLCIKRQKIIRNASNKFIIFKEILNEIKDLKYGLIYCSPQQIIQVQKILNDKNIIQHKFTQKEGVVKNDKYGGVSEREFLLKKFGEGFYHVLVAMKCLDEGVDVPPAKIAIMLDNSGNSREYIQRRGRILRKYPGKQNAIIYDIIVEPGLKGLTQDLVEIEKKIIYKELLRFSEFARSSMNASECEKVLKEIRGVYEL